MTTELFWLTLSVFVTSLFWVPYILDRMAVRGSGHAVRCNSGDRHATICMGAAGDPGSLQCG